jgi:thiamine-phosphate pyrophosphorylase
MSGNLAAALRLLLVTDDRLLAGRDPIAACREAVAGGVTAVQLRLKQAGDRELFSLARELVAGLPVPVFVNDRMDIALAANAAGVHLGIDDLPPERARRIAPAGFWIGASVGSDGEVPRGRVADYWGIGPLNGSSTKSDVGPALGVDGVTSLLKQAGGRPCVVIGAVTPSDVPEMLAAGFSGVAVSSGILAAPDLAAAARRYL